MRGTQGMPRGYLHSSAIFLSSLSFSMISDLKSGRLNVIVTKPPSEDHVGVSTPCAWQASMIRLAPLFNRYFNQFSTKLENLLFMAYFQKIMLSLQFGSDLIVMTCKIRTVTKSLYKSIRYAYSFLRSNIYNH